MTTCGRISAACALLLIASSTRSAPARSSGSPRPVAGHAVAAKLPAETTKERSAPRTSTTPVVNAAPQPAAQQQGTSFITPPTFSPPVFSPPAYSPLTFSTESFSAPVYSPPVFVPSVHSSPTHSPPTFSPPNYSPPVFGSTGSGGGGAAINSSSIDTSPPLRSLRVPFNNTPRPAAPVMPTYLWPSSDREPAETPHPQSEVNRFTNAPTSEYQAALAEKQAAHAELTALQQRADATSEERVAVSLRVLDAERRLAALEQGGK